MISSHAIPTVGPDCSVRVHFAGDDADVEVVLGAPRLLRALAKAAQAHLIRARSRQVLAHAEQPARLFSLAPDLLQGKGHFSLGNGIGFSEVRGEPTGLFHSLHYSAGAYERLAPCRMDSFRESG